jgi:hypothetical protein
LLDSSSAVGAGLTGLTSASSGLIISTIVDNEASATAYTAAGSTIESITTLGTYATPTATKCRFKELDSTNHKGVYEFQFADARFSVSNAKSLLISVSGTSNLAQADYVIPLVSDDPYVAKPTNYASLSIDSSGRVDMIKINGTSQTARDIGASVLVGDKTGFSLSTAGVQAIWDALTSALTTVSSIGKLLVDNINATISSRLASASYTAPSNLTAAQIATGVWQDATVGDFTTSGSIGKSLFTSGAVPGAAGGLFIAGTNAATTITTALTTTFTGNLTGNVGGNVTGSIGSLATQAKADVNAEVDTALADYDAPTHTELTAELATADDATLAAIAALNNLSQADVRSAVGLSSANLDTQLTAIAGYVDTEVASILTTANAIKLKTDNLPSDPADASDIAGAFSTVNSTLATIAGYVDTEIGTLQTTATAIKNKTDNLPSSPAATGDIPSAATLADAVWDEARADHTTAGTFGQGAASVQGNVTGSIGSLASQAKADVNAEADTALADAGVTTTVTGRIDAAISTRLANGSYTAPDNASVAAIKLKTDNLPASPAATGDIPTADQNADALLDLSGAIEVGLTLRQAIRLMAAVGGGKLSGAATATNTFRNAVADDTDRVVATMDASGNRTAITYDLG